MRWVACRRALLLETFARLPLAPWYLRPSLPAASPLQLLRFEAFRDLVRLMARGLSEESGLKVCDR